MVELSKFDAAEYLTTPEAIALYLEDALQDEDPGEFIAALGVVARSKGMAELAKDVGVARTSLYRSLSASAHPDFQTVMRVLKSFGIALSVRMKSGPETQKNASAKAEA